MYTYFGKQAVSRWGQWPNEYDGDDADIAAGGGGNDDEALLRLNVSCLSRVHTSQTTVSATQQPLMPH